MNEPLPPSTVKKMILVILESGVLAFSSHSLEEMEDDNLLETDVISCLRGGVVSPGELRNASYRYPVKTSRVGCAIAFRAETHLVVVTAWRIH